MSRVAQLDSAALDDEIRSIFWKDFQENVSITKNKEELQLLIETLVFLFSSKLRDGKLTETYGSQLSGVSYRCKRRTLYLVTTFSRYLESKVSQLIFRQPSHTLGSAKWTFKIFNYLSGLYSGLDLILFAKFLTKSSSFLTPLHRLFGVTLTDVSSMSETFHDTTVYSQMEFQNRQLLWNAILELFNTTLLSNVNWLKRNTSRPIQDKATDKKDTLCNYCGEFPTNPYTISCCKSVFCYMCIVKNLEWSYCPHCGNDSNLSGTPIY